MNMIVNPFVFAGGGGPPAWEGAPGFITSQITEISGNNTSANVAYPAGIEANDVAIIHIVSYNQLNAQTWNAPSGWDQIDQSDVNSVFYPTAAFIKRMIGGESGTINVSMTGSPGGSGSTIRAVMSIWRGCVESGTVHEGAGKNKGTGTNATSQTVTTTGDSRTVVNLVVTDDDTATFTPPSGYAEEYEYTGTLGPDGSMTANTIEQATAATVAASTTVMATSERWSVISCALIPENP